MKQDKNIIVGIHFDEIVKALIKMPKRAREDFIEDLIAATSPEYLESIREARNDYKKGRVYTHDEVFIEN